jgi:hypothetical protein
MHFHRFLFLFSLLYLSVPPSISAATGTDTKSQMKKIKSWNLKEWLEQKERNKMMDMWLVMHTPSPYEFALSYAHIGATQTIANLDTELEFAQAAFMAYASLVGLEFQSENNSTRGYQDSVGIFHFRPFGTADQSTHLTLNFGQKSRHYKNTIGPALRRQSFGEADLTIYFNDYFGIQAIYRSYMPIEDDPDWGKVTGSQYESGAFIDYEFIRVFLSYIHETEITKINNTQTDFSLDGYKSGVKIYF